VLVSDAVNYFNCVESAIDQIVSKENWGNDTVGGKLKYLENTFPTVTLPTTHRRQIGVVSHPRPRGKGPASNRLSYGRRYCVLEKTNIEMEKKTHKGVYCLQNLPAVGGVLI